MYTGEAAIIIANAVAKMIAARGSPKVDAVENSFEFKSQYFDLSAAGHLFILFYCHYSSNKLFRFKFYYTQVKLHS